LHFGGAEMRARPAYHAARGWGEVAGLVVLSVALGAALLIALAAPSAPTQLSEVVVDGIPLDAHAAAELSGGDGKREGNEVIGKRSGMERYRERASAISMHLSHMSSKGIDKLLKDNEKGEVDGIALDSHAMAALGGADSAHAAHVSHAERKSAAAGGSRAQRLLDEGKQDLDGRQWKAAVKLFARAKRIWKREGNANYRWAASLEHDVLRLHPGAKSAWSAVAGDSGHSAGRGRSDVRAAVRTLSAGTQFRSLYGLLRDHRAAKAARHGESIAQKAVAEANRVVAPYRSLLDAPARTQTLAEVPAKGGLSRMNSAVMAAEEELERKGKMELLHEKAKIVQMARELARSAATRAVRSEVRLGLPPAILRAQQPPRQKLVNGADAQTWSSSSGPGGLEMKWPVAVAHGQSLASAAEEGDSQEAEGEWRPPVSEYVQRQSREMEQRVAFPADEEHLPVVEQVHNALMRQVPAAAEAAVDERQRGLAAATPYERFFSRGRMHFDLDQVQPRYPSYAPPFPPQQVHAAEQPSSSPLEMREEASGKNKVPVVNINLPSGQVVPPGQYYMDGSLVQDLAGHWDYVGKLVPASARESAV
jgi:hypothetical protein